MELQVYLLTLVYLLIGSSILLSQRYSSRFILLLDLQNVYSKNRKMKLILAIIGMGLLAGETFFPIPPGPVFLGDLVEIINLFCLSFYYFYCYFQSEESVPIAEYGNKAKAKMFFGWEVFVVVILHFLFPSIVLI